MNINFFVTAPKSTGTLSGSAWDVSPVGGNWVCQFAGNQQAVNFCAHGRTKGRALRRMRRELASRKIPVNFPGE